MATKRSNITISTRDDGAPRPDASGSIMDIIVSLPRSAALALAALVLAAYAALVAAGTFVANALALVAGGDSSQESGSRHSAEADANAAVTTFITAQAKATRSTDSIRRFSWRMPHGAGSLDTLTLTQEYLDAPTEVPPTRAVFVDVRGARGSSSSGASAPSPALAWQVQVDVKAVGLNFADIFAVQGLYSATPKGAFVPGLEFAGVVSQVPANCTDCPYRVGDRVMGLTRFGAMTTVVNADTRCLFPVPQSWTFAEAASFLVQGLTAAFALHSQARVKPGEVVLVHSAAGGVGLAALRLCKRIGAHPIATVGSADKANFLLRKDPSLHVNQVIDRSACGTSTRPILADTAAELRRRYTASAAAAATASVLSAVSPVASPLVDALARALAPRSRARADFAAALDRACTSIEAKLRGQSGSEFASVLASNDTSVLDITAAALGDANTVARAVRPEFGLAIAKKLAEPTVPKAFSTTGVVAAGAAHGIVVRGVDISLDSLLGPYFEASMSRLSPGGRVVVFGAGSYASPSAEPAYGKLAWEFVNRPMVDPMELVPRNSTVSGFNLIWLWDKIDELPGLFALLIDALVNAGAAPLSPASVAAAAPGTRPAPSTTDTVRATLASIASAVASAASSGQPLATTNPQVAALLRTMTPKSLASAVDAAKVPGPHVGKTFSFANLPAALAFLQSGKSIGKVVVTVSDSDLKKLQTPAPSA